jgi:hypothetical protein
MLGTLPVVLDLPGWHAQDHDGAQVQLTDGQSFLMLRPGDPEHDSELGKMLQILFRGMNQPVTVGTPVGDRVPLSGKIDDESVVGFGRLIKCAGVDAILIEMSPDQATADSVAAKLQSARCLRPGEPPQKWPAAPAE